jgi:3-phosphoshikimate 1-carboxyvinyltransferase
MTKEKTLIAKYNGPISGCTKVPGDKSISHRAVLLSTLSEGETHIENCLYSDDVLRTIQVSRLLGSHISENNSTLTVDGVGLKGLKKPLDTLNFGNSGTSIRLFMGVLAAQKFESKLTGDRSLIKRPMDRVADPLIRMGANIKTTSGRAPINILPTNGLKSINYDLQIPSAQIKSAVLLASLFCSGETIINTKNKSRDHTEIMLKDFSSSIISENNKIHITGGELSSPGIINIPGDVSSAAFLILATLISKDSELIIENVGLNPTRTGFIEIMKLMGGNIKTVTKDQTKSSEKIGSVTITSSNLRGIKVPKNLITAAIDELPLVFLAGACAKGSTIIRNAEELRYKESDRISSMIKTLNQFSITTKEFNDGAIIEGGIIRGGNIDSFGDHRIAMTALVASCVSEKPIIVENCKNINTSFPTFKKIMNLIGMNIRAY